MAIMALWVLGYPHVVVKASRHADASSKWLLMDLILIFDFEFYRPPPLSYNLFMGRIKLSIKQDFYRPYK